MSSETKEHQKKDAVVAVHDGTKAPTPDATNGLAVTSLILGILAFLSGWFFLGLILGIAAVITGAIGLKKKNGKGMAIAGIITGALGAIASLIFTIILVISLIAGGTIFSQVAQDLQVIQDTQQAQLDAQKEFQRGETAIFGELTIKITNVERGYVPENEFLRASEGQQLIAVNLDVTYTGDSSDYVSPYDFTLVADGVGQTPSFADKAPVLEGGDLQNGGKVSGNVVFEVPADAESLTLQYATYVGAERVIYSLEV